MKFLQGLVIRILIKLLPPSARDFDNSAENRRRLVLLADSFVTSEAPETRLIPASVRRRVITTVLNEFVPGGTAEPAASLENVGVSALGDGVSGMPAPEKMQELGLRGLTVKVADDVDTGKVVALVNEAGLLTSKVKAFPPLRGVYTLEFSRESKPLMSEAYEVCRELISKGLAVYAEPNFAIPIEPPVDSGLPPGALEAAFGVPADWDRHHPETLNAFEWSLDRTFAKALWNHPQGSKGKGIFVGHIDTGYTLHPELKPSLDRLRGHDYWDDDNDALDPQEERFFDRLTAFPVLNPGHGTGTGSVIASPVGKSAGTSGAAWVTGTAPEATLIPFRATPSVIIVPGGSQDEVARAIVGASDRGVDVISMSLGSPWDSALLREAINYALSKGVIVCAAAGNVVAKIITGERVSYPARYAGVVAVAGCDYDYKPWARSSRGPEVDITAPGTDVWRAEANKDPSQAKAERGSGTSFAVSTVAGIAACWIARHGGRQALLGHYAGNARLIPAAFLLVLRNHAKTPLAAGDAGQFGGGVLHGQNLVNFALPSAQEVLNALPQFSPQAESHLSSLEAISPLAASAAAITASFQEWTGRSPEQFPLMQVRELSARIASDARLLGKWRDSLTAGSRGTFGLEASDAGCVSEAKAGSVATLGILNTSAESFAKALEGIAAVAAPLPCGAASPELLAAPSTAGADTSLSVRVEASTSATARSHSNSMKHKVCILRIPSHGATRNMFEGPLGGPVLEMAGLGAPGAVQLDVVDDMGEREMNDALRDPSVVVLAPAMPMKLIEPLDASGPAMAATGSTWGVRAVGADASAFTGAGVTVAVLDTGIETSHPAFNGVQLVTRDFTSAGSVEDTQGHGTHCAGTIFGRTVNGLRIGVAPGITRAVIGKVLGGPDGGGSDVLVSAMQWAVENGASIISMSLGIDFPGYVNSLVASGIPVAPATSRGLEAYRANVSLFEKLVALFGAQAAFAGRGVVIIAAAGNESARESAQPYVIGVSPPAAANGIVAVAALQEDPAGFKVARFSNNGASIAGPGVNVTSAWIGGGLRSISGTSMATPHVAGVAALWAQKMALNGPVNQNILMSRLIGSGGVSRLAPGASLPLDVGAGLAQAPPAGS